jgi:hypothetical protein
MSAAAMMDQVILGFSGGEVTASPGYSQYLPMRYSNWYCQCLALMRRYYYAFIEDRYKLALTKAGNRRKKRFISQQAHTSANINHPW